MATKSNSTKQSTKKTTGAKTSSRSKNSTKSGAGSKSTRTKSGKATGQSKSRSGTKSSNKRKSSKNQKLIRYEIELVLLFAFTVLSALSLHSKSIGVAGEFISHVYLGLFGGTAYIVPYFLAVFIFLGINKKSEICSQKIHDSIWDGIFGHNITAHREEHGNYIGTFRL